MIIDSPSAKLQLSRPREVRESLGHWLRLTRQRLEWTLPMLASRSGVPVSTLSRLEREGQGGIENLLRVFQALGVLDEVHGLLRERIRLGEFPQDLTELDSPLKTRQRVRTVKEKGEKNGPS